MTTTRRWFKTDDVYYDGIEWGTPAGQIMFIWDDITGVIKIDNDGQIYYAHNPVEARLIANELIKIAINQ